MKFLCQFACICLFVTHHLSAQQSDTISVVSKGFYFKSFNYYQGTPKTDITKDIDYILALDHKAIRQYDISNILVNGMIGLVSTSLNLFWVNSLFLSKSDSERNRQLGITLRNIGFVFIGV